VVRFIPKRFRTLATAITDMEGDHLTRFHVHGVLDLWLMRHLPHEASHFIRLHIQAVDDGKQRVQIVRHHEHRQTEAVAQHPHQFIKHACANRIEAR
jgi:hypothetical protein